MKMIKNNLIILGIILATLCSGIKLYSQPPEPNNCWSGDPCVAPWNCVDKTFDYQSTGIGMVGKMKYCWRICNGEVETIIDWSQTHIVDPNFLTSGSYEEIDFSAAKELLQSLILKDLINSSSITIPECSMGEKTFFNIYTARCGVWVKCSYKVDTQAEVMKDIGYEGTCPLPYNHSGDAYIDVWKWQSCGEICCKKTYQLCIENNPTYGGNVVRIKNVSKGPAPGEQCTDQGIFKDWKTGIPYPCEDGCSGSGN